MNPFKKTSGKDLLLNFWNKSTIDFLKADYIASSPLVAMDKIKEVSKQIPTESGHNIEMIEKIREAIFETKFDDRVYNGLQIQAPHTHWEDAKPIIYSFEKAKNRYIIGPTKIQGTAHYFPIAFVFTEKGIMPYEWCDSSVSYLEDINKFYQQIVQIYAKIGTCSFLGVNISFMFKNNIYEPAIQTMESPLTEFDTQNLSRNACIVPMETYEKLKEERLSNNDSRTKDMAWDNEIGQVAWHSKSDKFLYLNKEEEEFYSKLKEEFNNLVSDKEKEEFFKKFAHLLE